MSKILKIILIILGILIITSSIVAAYWLGQKKGASTVDITKNDSTTNQNSAATPSTQIDPQSLTYDTFNTVDGKLALKYPKDWIKSEVGNASSIVPKDTVDKYKIKIPLLVTLQSSNKLLQITLSYYEFSLGLTPDQVIVELAKESKNTGASMETVDQKSNSLTSLMENKYDTNNLKLQSKEKIMFLSPQNNIQPAYIVSFTSKEDNWNEYAGIANYIIDSAKLSISDFTDISASSVGTATATNFTSQNKVENNTTNPNNGSTAAGNTVSNSINSPSDNFSEIFTGKIAKGANSNSSTVTPTDQFDFTKDQFCIFGKTKKSLNDVSGTVKNTKTNNQTTIINNISLDVDEFKNCQSLSLDSGSYQFDMIVNNKIDKTLNFTVK